jgi:transketolase
MSITTEVPTLLRADLWRELGQQLRVDAIRATAVSGSGHPTSAMSAADLIACSPRSTSATTSTTPTTRTTTT